MSKRIVRTQAMHSHSALIARPASRQFISVCSVVVLALTAFLMMTRSSPRAAGVFSPTVSFQSSTSRATAHPDLRITIDNSNSDENIRNMTLDMPDGMWGSMKSAPKCNYADAGTAACDASKIGTVTNYAKVDDSDAILTGGVYLTTAASAHIGDDPAGIAIVVPTKVGGVDLGKVIVHARVMARYDNGVILPTAAVGPVKGIRTVVEDIPQSHLDNSSNLSGRTVSFLLKKLVVDLRSNQTGGNAPLLTNPSKCGSSSSFSASMTSWGGNPSVHSQPYFIDGCSTTKLEPSDISFTPTSTDAGDLIGLDTVIEFPENQSTMKSVSVAMPRFIATDTVALGGGADQCPAASIVVGGSYSAFSPALCPPAAEVGTVSIETPLLADPVQGKVYLITKSPIPWLGIYVDPTTGPSNPAGSSGESFL